MEPTAIETTAVSARSFTAAGLILIFGGTALLLLMVGAIAMMRRKNDRHTQLIGRTMLVGTITVIATLVLGGFEVLNRTAVSYLFIAELLLTVCGAWAIVLADAAMNEPRSGNDKVVWVIVIIFTGTVGALLYMTLRRPQRKLELAE